MNEETTKTGSGCWKFALFGCLGILGLGLVSSLLIGGLVFSSVRAESSWVEENSLFDEFERGEITRRPATASELADASTATAVPTDNSLLARPGGVLELDLRGGSFELRAHDGNEISVDGDFDEDRFELTQETVVEDDGSRSTRIAFAPTGSFQINNSSRNRVTVLVPRGERLALVGTVQQGESELDIGGLTLDEVDLELDMGAHRLVASEPTLGVLERFVIAGRMGEVRLVDIGNASPFGIDVRHRMGEIRLDLEGAWRNDAAISLRCSMGQCTADVPIGVRAEVDASAFMGGQSVNVPDDEDLPPDAITLRMKARATMGEVVVR